MVKRKGGGKKQVLHLSEFLGDAAPATPLTVPEYHNECSTDLSLPAHSAYVPTSSVDLASLPSAPRAQREGSFDPSKIPRSPPFTAYVGNLPFDSEDDDIEKMFARNTVKEVRLLKDKETGHFKGYGYVEFESAEGLIEALKMNEKMIRGRPIKVDVATTAGGGEGGTDRWERGKMNDRGEREPYVDNTSDDWRRDSKPQESAEGGPPPYTQRREYKPRKFGEDGDEEERPARRYNDAGPDTFSRSDFGSKMNEAAKEPYKPAGRFNDGHDDRGGSDRGGDRDRGADRGAWGRSDRPSENAWGRGEGRSEGRSEARNDAPSENAWVRHGELPADDEPRSEPRPERTERPRFALKARTVPLTEEQESLKKSRAAQEAEEKEVKEVKEVREVREVKPKVNPFGNAKPVDIQEKQRSAPDGDEAEIRTESAPKVKAEAVNPFGRAKPADTSSWRSSKAPQEEEPEPIRAPVKLDPENAKDEVDDIITDSNKFMILDEEEG